MCETICRKKNEPSVTVYHPFLLLHDRLGVVTVAYRAWSICAGARTPWNAFPSATGGERYPWVVMTNSESSLTDREDENDLWPPCFQVYQPLRVHDGRSTVAGITCRSNAVWKLFRKKKKVRTSASCDAVGLFTPLYHYRFMISLRVIQNDYGFLLAPKLHLPSNH